MFIQQLARLVCEIEVSSSVYKWSVFGSSADDDTRRIINSMKQFSYLFVGSASQATAFAHFFFF